VIIPKWRFESDTSVFKDNERNSLRLAGHFVFDLLVDCQASDSFDRHARLRISSRDNFNIDVANSFGERSGTD
jgi:hypothetical protein